MSMTCHRRCIVVLFFLTLCHQSVEAPCSGRNACHDNSTCIDDQTISQGYYCKCDQHGHFSSSAYGNWYQKNVVLPWKLQYCRENLALGKSATQSSTNMNKPSNAENAVDIVKTSGDINDHGCSLSTIMDDPWLMVDLTTKATIRQVLLKRADCCPAVVQLRIGNSQANGGIANNRCGELTTLSKGTYHAIYCNPPRDGRYLSVRYPGSKKELAICGLEIYSDFTDFDECSRENACVDEDRMMCVNTLGSFRCECEAGRTFDKDQQICIDKDECKLGIHNCSAFAYCHNTVPGYECFCNKGYQGDGYKCVDVNECQNPNEAPCGSDLRAHCINVIGSYDCSCSPGFRFNSHKKECEDINECKDKNVLCPTNKCVNIDGSYKCDVCADGYWKKGWICEDFDECKYGIYSCPENEACKNTIGSYICVCEPGYQRHDKVCKDIDECKSKTCPKHSICINTVGSYNCVCKPGYREEESSKNTKICQLVEGIHSSESTSTKTPT
ncbi:latent-transforming growth factor beta-binding protein 1-like [Exaiptasia diaphana]|uniref:EGF-like domain-containing protein n=1 Tax=Exaiptasia diaphana TaxID=2652724 RepID=A0A913XCY8_EXADI|nr:latent-transforming growth factor beta-binding protein 1-like [Exaiptasia diaphana]